MTSNKNLPDMETRRKIGLAMKRKISQYKQTEKWHK